ncbi:uncharacterized protein LOC129305818 [Prosopis cineraria]|uniref:uncharacterized protein LOC129300477 n=1 Tax=Prosopis cineraria TaxID=364024 RepID=UPI00240F19EC|nr:uncharacterized protein LOC129300477 [Prosopis cineraria]XP_054801910.1 uncharacterized protein LOC129305818 [Prosopis cineraria]
MDAEEVLKLYDSCWFELKILEENSSSRITSSSLSDPHHKMDQESSEPKLLRIKTTHTRSLSDQLSSITTFNKHDTFSPNSVLQADLQTIISGKQVTDPQVKETARENLEVSPSDHKGTARRRRKKRANKSLSDLEFEELKGFMDLGFVFSEEDKDSSLASIIPGLQRLGKKDEKEDGSDNYSAIQRPYLSEAWQVLDKQKKQSSLMNWRVPALNKEIDMKDSLRWWAHTVASTLK